MARGSSPTTEQVQRAELTTEIDKSSLKLIWRWNAPVWSTVNERPMLSAQRAHEAAMFDEIALEAMKAGGPMSNIHPDFC
jgi:hypothetical protein